MNFTQQYHFLFTVMSTMVSAHIMLNNKAIWFWSKQCYQLICGIAFCVNPFMFLVMTCKTSEEIEPWCLQTLLSLYAPAWNPQCHINRRNTRNVLLCSLSKSRIISLGEPNKDLILTSHIQNWLPAVWPCCCQCQYLFVVFQMVNI